MIAMAIAGLIMGAVGSAFYYILIVPPEQSDRLTAINELSFALERIQRDGVQAQEFGNMSYPYYCYFYSEDYPCTPTYCLTHNISYKYEDSTEPKYVKLVRVETTVETINGTTTTKTNNMTLSSHIDATKKNDDVSFAYDNDDRVTVNITVTLNPGTANEISKTDTRYIDMRAWDGSS